MMTRGVLVVGHGSRLPEVNEKFMELIDIFRHNTGRDVRGANLTLAKPDVEEVIHKMYEDGYRDIIVIPYFLSNGTHVVKSIPAILKRLKAELKGVEFSLKSSLLLDSLVIKAIENKINNN